MPENSYIILTKLPNFDYLLFCVSMNCQVIPLRYSHCKQIKQFYIEYSECSTSCFSKKMKKPIVKIN